MRSRSLLMYRRAGLISQMPGSCYFHDDWRNSGTSLSMRPGRTVGASDTQCVVWATLDVDT
eukprot:6710356-Karenia_brevis.AAC.1